MTIENVMYFALGFLAAGLLAVLITPSIWRRAVRLTKKRIEAATPMTLAEFRADKDQLRAEFALSTRRLEKNIEALRARLADQLGEISNKKTSLAKLKTERDQQLAIVQELEGREGELRRRIRELETTGTELAQRLSLRDDEFEAILERAHEEGDTAEHQQIQTLVEEFEAERERATYFEKQVAGLTARLEAAEHDSADATAAVAELRRALADKDDAHSAAKSELVEAESQIASAENRLNALLADTQTVVEGEQARTSQLLAEKLSLEEELERLRTKIGQVERAVTEDWETERLEQSHLREQLNDIASEVSRLVYAVDGESSHETDESLLDRVRKYAGDSLEAEAENMPARIAPARASAARGDLSRRLAALRGTHVRQ